MTGQSFNDHKAVVVGVCEQVLEVLGALGGLAVGREVTAGLRETVQRLEHGRFQVAFVGQMKAGKSTLVNAMVLGRQILPVASTPQTAKLTVIRRAEQADATVRFYSRDQWAELEALAAEETASGSVSDGIGEERFSYARILRDAHAQVGDELDGLLGTTRDIALDDLKDYVAAFDATIPQGRYVSVTHAVELRYPHAWPGQVDFVDTPGINDPDVLRERVTMDFLRQADAVIIVLYAGRPGDREDIEFLKRRLLPVGFNRIMIALNKWDMVPHDEGVGVRSYLREMLQENVIEAAKRSGVELPEGFEKILDLDHIYPVSGMRALLGRSEGDIPEGKFYFKQTCKKKGIETWEEALATSGVLELEAGLLDFLMSQKGRELLVAPLRKADGALREVIRRAEQARERAGEQLRDMRRSEEELHQDLVKQRKRLADVEGAIAEVKGLIRLWTRQQLDRAQVDGVRRVKAFVDDVQHGFVRRVDGVGAFNAATNQAHILELNTDLAWRARTLHSELEQVMVDGLLRLRRRLQGDLQDEIRQRIPDYTASPWIMEDVDAIGRLELLIELPPLRQLSEESTDLRGSVRQIIKAAEYRATLKQRLMDVALAWEKDCLDYVKTCPATIEARVQEQVGAIIDHVRSHVQDRIDDVQRALDERTHAVEEVQARRAALVEEMDRLSETIRASRGLLEHVQRVRDELGPDKGEAWG